MQTNSRDHLIEIYHAALIPVMGRDAVKCSLAYYSIDQPTYVVAIGKAAAEMYRGAEEVLGNSLAAGLVITKEGALQGLKASSTLEVIEAGHPWPTGESLKAGRALLDFMERAPGQARFLFLISGGTSSLVEVLPEGITLDDLRRLNDWLLKSGLDIHAMNYVRKAVSCIKGGRLANYLNGRSATVLLISDVPGDEPATIGSGLLVPEILLETEAPLDLPEWIEALMAKGTPAPLQTDPVFDSIDVEVIATLDDARQAAAEAGRRLGYEVYLHSAVIAGDVELVGNKLAVELLDGPGVLHVWGGETTVRLPERPGRGGRNQQLALIVARQLDGEHGITFLAAGTDGSDGPTEDAGAVVDGGTIERGRQSGMEEREALAAMDAGRFLEASGDLIRTGPTGTNVMDLMLGLKSQ